MTIPPAPSTDPEVALTRALAATPMPPGGLFDVPGVTWHQLSPRYRTLELVNGILWWVPVTTVATVVLALVHFSFHEWVALTAGVLGAWALLWRSWWIVRSYPMWGWAETDTDLLIRHGRAWRWMVAVPYGRMQSITIESGILSRQFKLAEVHLETAARHTHALIPGMEEQDAMRLRSRLAERGEHLSMGL